MTMLSISIGFGDFISLFIGIIVGCTIGAGLYLKRVRHKVVKHIGKRYDMITNESQEIIEKYIYNITNYHIKARKNKTVLLGGLIKIKKHVDYDGLLYNYLSLYPEHENQVLTLFEELKWLVVTIAKESCPDSKHPLCELTIEEAFMFINNIIDLVDDALDQLMIPHIKDVKISLIIQGTKYGTKFVDTFNKWYVRVPYGIVNTAIKVRNFINPVYWIKKSTSKATNNSLLQYIFEMLFEICGKETASIYYNHMISEALKNQENVDNTLDDKSFNDDVIDYSKLN